MNTAIKKATEDDISELLDVMRKAFLEFKSAYTKLAYRNTVLDFDSMKRRIQKMNVYKAVTSDDRIIGTVSWYRPSSQEAHIRGMAIVPEFRQQGIGRLLLEMVETDAKKNNCNIVTLDTTEVLVGAHKFYQKNGYVKSGNVSNFHGMKIEEYVKSI